MKLSIVIVSYNVCHYLLQCLDSVERATLGIQTEVWVVDNASTDDSVAMVRRHYPGTLVIANRENVGFAKANNMALRQATGDYTLLLNPDTIVAESTLHKCLRFMDEHPEVGALGTHMLNRDGSFAPESRRGLPTPATAFYKMCGLARLFPKSRRFGRYHMRYLDESEPSQIDVISGAFFLARRQQMAEVGYLDEDYFMYGEDIDLSYRLLGTGLQNWYFPADILHYKGESTQKTSYRYVHNFYSAMLIFYRKHFARRHRITTLFVWPAVITIAALEIVELNGTRCLAAIRDVMRRFLPAGRREATRETVYFKGREAALQKMLPLAEAAGYRVVSEFTDAMTYYVFEAEHELYEDMMATIKKAHASGLRAHLGIYHSTTNTLILPNEVIC